MKFKVVKFTLNCAITSTLLVVTSFLVLAMTDNTKQVIHIESNTQSLDMQGNILIFIGNVILMHGTIKINADKVVITNLCGKQGKEIIDGYGNPATFYQIQDNGKLVKGYASHMRYKIAKGLVILMGNAYLEHLDSNITSDKITYLVKKQKMQAYSEKGKRVTTVLIPYQIWDKNNSQASVQR